MVHPAVVGIQFAAQETALEKPVDQGGHSRGGDTQVLAENAGADAGGGTDHRESARLHLTDAQFFSCRSQGFRSR